MILQHKHRKDYLHLFILSIVTVSIWHPLTNLVIQWEGYMYLNAWEYLTFLTNPWTLLTSAYVQGTFVGALFSKLFGLNMPLYFWAEIFSILTVNICVYFLARTLTRNSTTAFVAAFIFAVNFFGNTNIFLPNFYGGHFLERVIMNVPIFLVSFIYLHRFLAEKKIRYYAISLLLFFLSIFLTHFSILLSFPIFLYPFFWEIGASFRLRSALRAFMMIIPHTLIVIFFTQMDIYFSDQMLPKENILYFLTHPDIYRYPEGMLRQLVYISQYPSVIDAIRLRLYPLAFNDPPSAYRYVIPIVTAYGIGFLIIWKKVKKYRALLLTIVSSVTVSFLANMYLDRFDPFDDAKSQRYYYFPSVWLSMFWSLVATTIFSKKRFILYGVISGFFLINLSLFQHHFFYRNLYSVPTKKLYEYIVRNYTLIQPNSLVIVGPTPDFGPYDTTFFTEQLGDNRNIVFRTEDVSYGDWRPMASTSAHLVMLTYDNNCSCVKQETLR